MLHAVKILIISVVFINSTNGQDRYESFPTWVKSVPEYGFSGIKYTITQNSNLLILGTTSIGALLAYKFDDQLQDYVQREGLVNSRVSQFGDLYGGIWSAWLLPVSIIITSKSENESNRDMLEKLEFVSSALVANGVTTIILKELISRKRPNGGDHSMPSGHTSHSFAVAAIANELFGNKVGTAAYLVAGLVAVSRINENRHYLSDVIVGAGLGTVIGRGFSMTYKDKKYVPNMTVKNRSINFNFYL